MKIRSHLLFSCLALASSFWIAANFSAHAGAADSPLPVGQRVTIKTPLGLRPVPIPVDNPPTRETIALGRRLYYEITIRSLPRMTPFRALPVMHLSSPSPMRARFLSGLGARPATGTRRP
jgi:hypothetical protein